MMAKIASIQPNVVEACWKCEFCWKNENQRGRLTGQQIYRAICEKQGWKTVDQWKLDEGCPLEDYKPGDGK